MAALHTGDSCPKCKEGKVQRIRRRKWMRWIKSSKLYKCSQCRSRYLTISGWTFRLSKTPKRSREKD